MAAAIESNVDRTLANNRKALHEYHIEERLEAGLVLTGSEIKSVRAGQISLQEAYAQIDRGEAWLLGAHIAPYENAGYAGHDPLRRRKLLLHAKQIIGLAFQLKAQGMTLVPLRVYLKNGRAKLELGLARGKKQHDKRQAIREKDDARQMARAAARVGRE
jgi:SsrA-binding protein